MAGKAVGRNLRPKTRQQSQCACGQGQNMPKPSRLGLLALLGQIDELPNVLPHADSNPSVVSQHRWYRGRGPASRATLPLPSECRLMRTWTFIGDVLAVAAIFAAAVTVLMLSWALS